MSNIISSEDTTTDEQVDDSFEDTLDYETAERDPRFDEDDVEVLESLYNSDYLNIDQLEDADFCEGLLNHIADYINSSEDPLTRTFRDLLDSLNSDDDED